ncbi:MAG: nucleoside triphosphate pyrophosphohydrolase family protein [Candidatus Binataceae bacterium]
MSVKVRGADIEAAIALDEYQKLARQTDQNRDIRRPDALTFSLLGLSGEVGTLLSAFKKKQRDEKSFLDYEEALIEEFGDSLWYFSNVCSRSFLKLSRIAQNFARRPLASDGASSPAPRSFDDAQFKRYHRGSASSPRFEAALISLAGKVGLMLDAFDSRAIPGDRRVLIDRLTDIFQALVRAADLGDISLGTAAVQNLRKIESRWPQKRKYSKLFDEGSGELERLPRKITMKILETRRRNKTYVIQQCNGINIGAALTDNRMVDDDYRFHDVFHLAYAAILGWSPVMRSLFNVKRKSDPKIDEAQDGGRAIAIEEGISTFVFHRAERLQHFASIESLDYSLLKSISEFVRGYEVDQCALWQWEKAILDGYRVFRKFREYRRGIVIADLEKHRILFKPLPS